MAATTVSRHMLSLGSLLITCAWTVVASADCAAPPALIWSYPADDAEDVPTNATLIVAGSPASVTMNGLDLAPLGSGLVYDLGDLLPLTEYTIIFEENAGADSGAATISFTTGGGPLDPTESEPTFVVSDEDCIEIRTWQGCFDTGSPDTVHLKPTTSDTPPAWGILAVQGATRYPVGIWPAACGTITVDTYQADPQFELEPLHFDGPEAIVGATINAPDDSGGCSIARGPTRTPWWIAWIGAALLLVARKYKKEAVRGL